MDRADLGDGLRVRGLPSASAAALSRSSPGRRSRCSVTNRRAMSASGAGIGGRDRPPPRARRALRMTATSIASWTSAPAAGGRKPSPATTIAASDIPIPTSTLCRAISPARLATAIASASRSRRSTVSTTSAASDEAVTPLAPHRDADVGAGQRRRVVDAVADHDRRTGRPAPRRRRRPCRPGCTRRARCRRRARRRRSRPRRPGRPTPSRPVLMPLRRSSRIVRAASGRTGSSSRNAPAGSPSMATNTVSAPSRSARRRIGRRPPRIGAGRHPRRLADRDLSRPADHARAHRSRRPPRRRLGSTAARSRLVAARTMAAATTWGDTWSSDAAARRISSAARPSTGTTSVTTGRPTVSVPVLSSSSTRPCGQPLQRDAALDDHPARGGAGEAGGDGDRRGEDQRAGCRHDQHRHGSDGVTRHDPGQPRRRRASPPGRPLA